MTEIGCERVIGAVAVSDVVATLPSFAGVPDVVVQYAICPFVSLVDVDTDCVPPDAEPVKVIGVEPRMVKEVHDTVPAQVAVVVATLPNVLTPVQYGICPIVGADDVESPPKPTVVPERVIGNVVLIVACLLLNVVQSVEVRHPFVLPFAEVQSNAPPVPPTNEPSVPE